MWAGTPAMVRASTLSLTGVAAERCAFFLVRYSCGRMEPRAFSAEVPLLKRLLKQNLKLMFNLWPPLMGAGIRIKRIQPDWKEIDVEMKLRRWNANYVGTHYGGSLYSITDPFYMVMFIEILGRDYIVWDKAATIRFLKPGRGRVCAHFKLSKEDIENIRIQADKSPKYEPQFTVKVLDLDGQVIAEVDKTVYVRRKLLR